MTFFDQFTQRDRRIDLSLAIHIEGVPFAFVERLQPSATFGRVFDIPAQLVVIADRGITEGETSIDLDERRERGATLDVMLEDTAAGDLLALFATNARRRAWINQDIDETISTIVFNTNGFTAANSVVYIGSETVIVGPKFSTQVFNSCIRGAYGSTAARHQGQPGDGESAYLSVPAWRGRRAYLYGYSTDVDGTVIETLLSTWLVDTAPENMGDSRWRLRFGGLAHEYYSRAVYTGVQSAKAIGPSAIVGGVVATTVDNPNLLSVGVGFPSYVIVESEFNDEAATSIVELTSVNYLSGAITLTTDALFGTPPCLQRVKAVRHLFTLGGTSGDAVLYALLSRYGDAVASTYDRLPGRDGVDVYDTGFSLGARFKESEVNIASFTSTSPMAWSMCLARELDIGALLTEYGILTGAVTRVDRLGRLTLVPLAERVTSLLLIDASVVDPDVEPSVFHDENSLVPLLTARTNYDPLLDDFAATFNFVDVDLLRRYPRDPQRTEVEFMTQALDLSTARASAIAEYATFRPAVTVDAGAIANTVVRDIQRGDGAGRRYISLACTFAALQVYPGDVLRIGNDLPPGFANLPDFEGGTISGKAVRVVARRPDWQQGRVTFRLQILDEVLVVCPASVIAAISGDTIALTPTSPEASSASPELDFYVGAPVRLYDLSALAAGGTPTFFDTSVIAILSSPPRLQLKLPPTFTVQPTVDYVVLNPQGVGSTFGVNGKGYSSLDMATVVDDDGVGANNPGVVNNEPRWR